MSHLRTSAYSAYCLHYHLVLVTKYRRKCLNDAMLADLKSITERVCEGWNCKVIEVNGEADHIHVAFEATPTEELSRCVGSLKTVTSRPIRRDHADTLAKFYRVPVLWSGSYAVMTTGGAPLEVLKRYIQAQGSRSKEP